MVSVAKNKPEMKLIAIFSSQDDTAKLNPASGRKAVASGEQRKKSDAHCTF